MKTNNKKLNIVLFNPLIYQNTGNIIRTCKGLNANLHLIRPYGFVLTPELIKRCSVNYDYSYYLFEYIDWKEFESINLLDKGIDIYLLTKFATNYLGKTNFDSKKTTYLVFGNEEKGLSQEIKDKYGKNGIKIEMNNEFRCYNLANSVAITGYYYHLNTKFINQN